MNRRCTLRTERDVRVDRSDDERFARVEARVERALELLYEIQRLLDERL